MFVVLTVSLCFLVRSTLFRAQFSAVKLCALPPRVAVQAFGASPHFVEYSSVSRLIGAPGVRYIRLLATVVMPVCDSSLVPLYSLCRSVSTCVRHVHVHTSVYQHTRLQVVEGKLSFRAAPDSAIELKACLAACELEHSNAIAQSAGAQEDSRGGDSERKAGSLKASAASAPSTTTVSSQGHTLSFNDRSAPPASGDDGEGLADGGEGQGDEA